MRENVHNFDCFVSVIDDMACNASRWHVTDEMMFDAFHFFLSGFIRDYIEVLIKLFANNNKTLK